MRYDLKLKDVTIEKHLAPLPAVLGDRRALQQVVLNLLNNAAQAVTTNPPGRPQVIHLSTWFDDRVRLRVADSGPGIPDDVLPQLFTPFFTTKEPGQGTGLGLSITYSIVEAHGGRITVRSEEHTSELQSHSDLVCRLLLEKKKRKIKTKIELELSEQQTDVKFVNAA